ncbi:hypothetical protein RJ40_09890 [Methanofollis aquaemaris]|uniref:Uncharacterized protein n=1 Tax=Methanofollis aquaemaris TaxID=126734 RepID=A0A8A3S6X1_9EURY|nr:hypothetical protein [Methanofollis aquaemaris]QSZ67792.1 hypothetical protein RJ40_09890 [Methanofollis aquaemaris]
MIGFFFETIAYLPGALLEYFASISRSSSPYPLFASHLRITHPSLAILAAGLLIPSGVPDVVMQALYLSLIDVFAAVVYALAVLATSSPGRVLSLRRRKDLFNDSE